MKSDPYIAQYLLTLQVGEIEQVCSSDFITPSRQLEMTEEVEERFNLLQVAILTVSDYYHRFSDYILSSTRSEHTNLK